MNTDRIDASDSPINLLKISDGPTGTNAASASLASALASSVFPHPGGPYMKIEVRLDRIPEEIRTEKDKIEV